MSSSAPGGPDLPTDRERRIEDARRAFDQAAWDANRGGIHEVGVPESDEGYDFAQIEHYVDESENAPEELSGEVERTQTALGAARDALEEWRAAEADR